MHLSSRIEHVCERALDERQLRIAVLAELRTSVPFDAYAWLLTDPATGVGWSPVAEVPVLADLPEIIGAKYCSRLNRWTDTTDVVATLATAAEDELAGSPFARLIRSRYSIADVASVMLRDRSGCWGFVDLWRHDGRFDEAECALLADIAAVVTPALRRSLLPAFAEPSALAPQGPAVMLLGEDLRPLARTSASDAYMAALLPPGPGQVLVPAAALNVAARLRAIEAGADHRPARARICVPGRSWMTIGAGRIETADGAVDATITVSIEPATPQERSSLYSSVAGLTPREAAVLEVIIAGDDSRHSARRLGITEHTLQDHMKAVLAKTGASSRRQLVSRALGR